jgi:hypothetical protein
MQITEHIFIALAPVVLYYLIRYQRLPDGMIVLTGVFAGIFADLVDKPLAWTLGIIPSGRMLAHSIVVSVPLLIIILLVAYRTETLRYAIVFSWGHLLHIAGDFYPVLWEGSDYYYYPNLFWPLMKPSPVRGSFEDSQPTLTTETLLEFSILAIVLLYIAIDIGRKIHKIRKSPV